MGDDEDPVQAAPAALAESDVELRGFRELTTSHDLGDFRDHLNTAFSPASVSPPDGLPVPPRLSAVRLQHLTLGFARFGVEASVAPGVLPGYHVNVPVSGAVLPHCGDAE